MQDLISRQAAIDALKRISFSHWFECGEYLSEDTREIEIINSNKALEVIEALPSAQPERKTGRWEDVHIDVANDDKGRSYRFYSCTACGVTSIPAMLGMKKKWLHFCPNCGAKMEDCEA